MHGTTMK